ncbi:MAG: 3-hydroxyacyl-CoA dehydrogenase NAD-binding domain-containing protein [Alphaproteobacteria bacterium]|nr:3-hydroxyacyl-CoA dehydrogenase NAD-binding domain-containing protein [Alphaproteobacteria bacterium]
MTAINQVTDLDIRDGIAVLTLNSPPVNALSGPVRDGLHKGIKQAIDDSAVQAVVLVCAGRTFIAGADITELGSGGPQGASLLDVQNMMEDSTKPVVAAIHGTALGGGLEVALCCHYRVAVASAQFGLPEVKLGLLPGAGGTQRLPRIVGAEMALEMMGLGDPIGADKALEVGLISEIVDGDLTQGGVAFAKKLLAQKRPLVRVRDNDAKLAPVRGKPEIFAAFRAAHARKNRGFLAPEYNIRCVEAAVNLPFDQGIRREGELFRELLQGPQSAAQRYMFFAERQAAKIPDVPADTQKIPVDKAGVIGAGTMGGGITMNLVNVGIPVTIVETTQEALDRGLKVVRGNYENTARKGKITQADVETRMALITPSLNLADLADVDIVIEAVFENMDIKKDIFEKLDAICKPGAILATNTSALDINAIAAMTKRPEYVIGTHFFSPANVMKLVEVVRGAKTAKNVIATSMALGKRINKIAVLAGVCHGFIGNRMLFARTTQSSRIILEGATPERVDKVLTDFGFPMGPFAMSDLAGVDVGWNPKTSKGETLRDRLCEAGRRGQKTNAGYYDYKPGDRTPIPNEDVVKMIREFAASKQIRQRDVTDEEILERCLIPMVNEGAKILSEGIAIRASDIDVVWVHGYGWPVYRGGPMYWANTYGLDKIVARMREFANDDPVFWTPAPLLEELAASNGGFK